LRLNASSQDRGGALRERRAAGIAFHKRGDSQNGVGSPPVDAALTLAA